MLDWLKPSLQTNLSDYSEGNLLNLAVRLVGAGLAGWIVALIAARGMSRSADRTLPLTLILMSVLIAMATQIIGDNVARAFSLVGALSIVRFRTAVPESRDVAFVLASVVVGMAIGAGQWLIAGCGLGVVAIANQTFGGWGNLANGNSLAKTRSKLSIQTSGSAGPLPDDVLQAYCRDVGLISAFTSRKGEAMTYVYQIKLQPTVRPDMMLTSLKNTVGVESVSWSQNFDRDD
jgi:uncharacterized membrane protein YhiD involved in acid resistance